MARFDVFEDQIPQFLCVYMPDYSDDERKNLRKLQDRVIELALGHDIELETRIGKEIQIKIKDLKKVIWPGLESYFEFLIKALEGS